ncbi:hypothetical protein [Actinacidiphila soli]|uniref:hypothetical protein n=1 Tax=Actinacidiphila soli TaxID=2487275 RepID=UPI000FCA54F7|nr:hypothetical protein [Actinacidiphila soli]
MTKRHLPYGTLRAWRVERAPGVPELTQAGRIAIPVRLRRIGERVCVVESLLVLTAEDAEALCGALAGLMNASGQQAAS